MWRALPQSCSLQCVRGASQPQHRSQCAPSAAPHSLRSALLRMQPRIRCQSHSLDVPGQLDARHAPTPSATAPLTSVEDAEDEEGEEGEEGEYEEGEYQEGEYEEGEDYMEEDEDETTSTSTAGPTTPLVYNEAEFVDVGVITTPHGIRGEVKVRSLTFDPEERFCTRGNRLFLMPSTSFGGSDGTPLRQVTVQYGRLMIAKAAECWVVKFREVPTRNEAELLRRWRVLMLEADRPPLDGTGEYYVTDLMGLRVSLQDGTEIGTVVDLLEGTGTYDTLRVELRPQDSQPPPSRPATVLVPFVEAFCPEVDLKARRMTITPPEGLLELASAPKERKPTRRGGRGRQRQRQSQQAPAT